MDWFLYDNGLRLERVNTCAYRLIHVNIIILRHFLYLQYLCPCLENLGVTQYK